MISELFRFMSSASCPTVSVPLYVMDFAASCRVLEGPCPPFLFRPPLFPPLRFGRLFGLLFGFLATQSPVLSQFIYPSGKSCIRHDQCLHCPV